MESFINEQVHELNILETVTNVFLPFILLYHTQKAGVFGPWRKYVRDDRFERRPAIINNSFEQFTFTTAILGNLKG